MTATQKILACIAIGVLWLTAIVALHFFPDLKGEIAQFTSACFTALVGLGAFHAGQSSSGTDGAVALPFTAGTLTQGVQPSGQTGFASVRLLSIVASIALGIALLAGCTSLDNAGHTAYSAEFTPIGCKVTVADGKEFAERTIAADCQKGQFAVDEKGVKAFKGEAIAAKAAAVLPITDLANIIKGDGK